MPSAARWAGLSRWACHGATPRTQSAGKPTERRGLAVVSTAEVGWPYLPRYVRLRGAPYYLGRDATASTARCDRISPMLQHGGAAAAERPAKPRLVTLVKT